MEVLTTKIVTLLTLSCLVGSAYSDCTSHSLTSTQTTGVIISSSNYPHEGYDNHESLCWDITVDTGNLEITPKDVITERCCDYTRVYDGTNSTADRVVTFSGFIIGTGRTRQTTSSDMHVTFRSDFSITAPGFQACICPADIGCSCTYIDTTELWEDWPSWDDWNDWRHEHDNSEEGDWERYRHRYDDDGLSRAAKAAIGIGVLMLIAIPIIIGVTVACCCGGGKCKTTQSEDTYANMRRHTTFTNIADTTESTTDRDQDRKHNQVRPVSMISTPPTYTQFTPPPAYNEKAAEAMGGSVLGASGGRLPPIGAHLTPSLQTHGHLPPLKNTAPTPTADTDALFVTSASAAPLATGLSTDPPKGYLEPLAEKKW